ncbi:transposon Ty3-I Gag-Pol polyprotein [Trichonephila clavipes]|nr:transposon Ty3-I Gag-Pol polyprotein [Trichonephila clavipes]
MSSKFPEAIPVSDISSVSVTDALLNIFSRMGFPREIQCDQGTSFTSALTTEFLKIRNTYAGSEWDKHPPSILLALRTVSHESTVRVGVWEKFANPRDVSNGTLDGTGRRG